MLISAAKFARNHFYEDKNNGGVLIFFIAVSLLVEVAKLLVINFSKAVNKNQNIFTIFDNFSLVRDQTKILTLYRSLTLKIHIGGHANFKVCLPQFIKGTWWGGFLSDHEMFNISHRGAAASSRLSFIINNGFFSKAGPRVGCMPIFVSSLATA